VDLPAALLDLVLPQACAGCGLAGCRLCASCVAVLAAMAEGPLGRTAPSPVPAGFPPAAAAATYDGVVRAALVAHKERGRLGLVHPLGRALAAAVAELDPPPGVVLVPVPSARAAVRARGHDHARRLAGATARELTSAGRPARALPLLRPARALADQAGLGSAGRAANLDGAFAAVRRLSGLVVVVVDDLVTTGATLVEAARALAGAGAHVHGAATVAATQRRPVTNGVPLSAYGLCPGGDPGATVR
jgi:predicted amidophosphoribosyltransferase